MALKLETIKKIDARTDDGHLNVGMIKDNVGRIIWRKKYDKLSIGLADASTGKWSEIANYAPNNVMTGTSVAENNYFHYNDRVDIFEPINLNAKLVVSWPSVGDYSQLQDISLLVSQATTYSATSAVNFNYPVHTPGIARELGPVTYQSYGRFGDAANDTTACVSSFKTTKHPESTWSEVLEGSTNMARIQNGPQALMYATSSRPSGDYVECLITKRTLVGGQAAGYSAKFTLHQASSDFKYVSFFVVDNSIAQDLTNAKLITLFTGSGNSQTITSTGLNWDILQVGTYVNSTGSYVNGGKFGSLTTTGTIYIPLALGSNSYKFCLNASGEIYNANTKITSSFSYCNILFKRPSTKYTGLRITYSQDSERNFDFGIFSEIDKQLCPANVLDSTSTKTTTLGNKKIYTGYGSEVVKRSCKGESGTYTITYNISKLDPGTPHSICVKYIKDGSGDTGTDTFKITKIEFVEDVEYDFHYDAAASYYTLTVKNNSSKDVTAGFLHVYIEGSSDSYFDPDEWENDIPAGGSYDFWLHPDPMPEQSGRIFCIFFCDEQYHTIYQ